MTLLIYWTMLYYFGAPTWLYFVGGIVWSVQTGFAIGLMTEDKKCQRRCNYTPKYQIPPDLSV